MKITSQEANKLLSKIQEDIQSWKEEEQRNCKFTAATIENKEDVRPRYNFHETQNEICLLEEKVRRIKHAINVFNCNTEIEIGNQKMTIDQVLVFLPQLNRSKNRLWIMLQNSEFRRKQPNAGIIDYEYLNYDLKDVREEYEAINKLITDIQNELNKVNVTVEFDIPD